MSKLRARVQRVNNFFWPFSHTLPAMSNLSFSINSPVKDSLRQEYVPRGSPLSVCCAKWRLATKSTMMYLKNGFTNRNTENITDTLDR